MGGSHPGTIIWGYRKLGARNGAQSGEQGAGAREAKPAAGAARPRRPARVTGAGTGAPAGASSRGREPAPAAEAELPGAGQPSAHDIRTPLHALKGNLEVVLSDTDVSLTTEARCSLGQIVEAVGELEEVLRQAGLLEQEAGAAAPAGTPGS